MKYREFYKKYVDSVGHFEIEQTVVINLGCLDLGNSFTYSHFINALSLDQLDFIQSTPVELSSNVRLIGVGNFGKVSLSTCGNDLFDHI